MRCHTDGGVPHPEGRVDPIADIELIETELLAADLEQAERRLERVTRQARSQDKEAVAERDWLERVVEALGAGRPVREVAAPEAAGEAARRLFALTSKPVLYVANVEEGVDVVPPEIEAHAAAVGAKAVAISARVESELGELDDTEAAEMRGELGISEAGLDRLIHGAFELLDLIVFFTAGEDKEAMSQVAAPRLERLGGRGADPRRDPAGVRARRGGALGGARRGRRLRGGPRSRPAAHRGTLVPDQRWRRDHDQGVTKRVTAFLIQRSGRDQVVLSTCRFKWHRDR